LRRSALTLALCFLLLAGCGDDDDDSGRTVTAPANAKLRVVGDEYSFDPSAIMLRGAGTLTLTLRNEGSVAHNLKVFRGGEEIGGTPTLQAGRSESTRLNLEHGSYRMVCTVGDHEQQGMKGTLQVR
jgi:plastocyanin